MGAGRPGASAAEPCASCLAADLPTCRCCLLAGAMHCTKMARKAPHQAWLVAELFLPSARVRCCTTDRHSTRAQTNSNANQQVRVVQQISITIAQVHDGVPWLVTMQEQGRWGLQTIYYNVLHRVTGSSVTQSHTQDSQSCRACNQPAAADHTIQFNQPAAVWQTDKLAHPAKRRLY